MPFIKFFKLKPSFCHRVTHPTAHRWEPCEICGIVKVLRTENVRHDEVVGEAGDGLARVSHGSIAARALSLSRAGLQTDRGVGRHAGWLCMSVRVVVRRRGFREMRFFSFKFFLSWFDRRVSILTRQWRSRVLPVRPSLLSHCYQLHDF